MAFELPKLNYAFDALEPNIDAKTMEIHYGKHHNGYTNNLNNIISGTDNEGKSIEDIINSLDPENKGLRNNGGGYYNHNLFWEIMGPNGGGDPSGEISESINSNFGSFENFKNINESIAPASLTKLMTSLILIENYNLSDYIQVSLPSDYLYEGKVAYLKPGQSMTIESLLEFILIYSANDACFAVASLFSEDMDDFTNLMNNRAPVSYTHLTLPTSDLV